MSVSVAIQDQRSVKTFKQGGEISGQFPLVPLADYRLIELMRSNQGVPCFICAPQKTGRTSLALNYAQHQYTLDEVLWIDATADGFSDAVNGGSFFEHLERQIANSLSLYRLVIIDNLPWLSERQASRFSDWIDQLIADEVEVIVITTPHEDCLYNHQSDRLLIEGGALIVSQKWPKDRLADCLHSFFNAPIPQETHILAALMMAMGRGVVDSLRELHYQIPANSHAQVKRYCPFIEIDEVTGYFNTRGFPLKELSAYLIEGIDQAPRGGLDAQMTGLERSFERLTQLSVHLFENSEREQSQLLLELAGSLLTCDDAGYPLTTSPFNQTETITINTERNVAMTALEPQGFFENYEDERSRSEAMAPIHEEADIFSELQDEPEQLIVRLFGDFKVFKGGKRLEGKQLQRSKVRALLIHLALNMGRGVPRDYLLERIWPEKDYSHAKDNFYSTWSMLNSMLSKDTKTSPYLSNKQGLCRLEPKYVLTDVHEFERLSKAVIFQQGSVADRVDAIYRLEQLYRGDIMSGTHIDTYVQAAQCRYRAILVDVMIEASLLFSREGNDTNAVWFARKAYDTDPTREDVYRTLMAMQDKAGQRTSALKTYFDCKRFLSEELGILPSQKTIALYQELVLDRR